jgi:hypothetical protein
LPLVLIFINIFIYLLPLLGYEQGKNNNKNEARAKVKSLFLPLLPRRGGGSRGKGLKTKMLPLRLPLFEEARGGLFKGGPSSASSCSPASCSCLARGRSKGEKVAFLFFTPLASCEPSSYFVFLLPLAPPLASQGRRKGSMPLRGNFDEY